MLLQLRNPKFYLLVILDALSFVLSLFIAFLARSEFNPDHATSMQLMALLPYAVLIKIGVYLLFGHYKGMWRYTDVRDLWNIFLAATSSSLVIVSVLLYLYRFEGYSRGVFIVDWFLTILLTGGLRLLIRTAYLYKGNLTSMGPLSLKSFKRRTGTLKQIIIIGAGNEGNNLLKEIMADQSLGYDVVGLLDDDMSKRYRSLHGVPILGTTDNLQAVLKKYDISLVFIASLDLTGDKLRRIVDVCKMSQVEFKTLPSLGEILAGRVSIRKFRDVRYEDLLGRSPVRLDMEAIKGILEGRSILVTGAGGTIGSELCRQIVRFQPRQMIMLDASESNLYGIQMEVLHELYFTRYKAVLGSIQDQGLLYRLFDRLNPELVFHAAAYKHVPMLELNPWEAVLNNVHGTNLLMRTAVRHGVERFVLVSTDKAVRPTNVMGATKRVAEILMQHMDKGRTKFHAVRFGNVVGSSGSVIPLFQRQIAHGGPVTVTHPEVTRYFMTIPEAAQLILQAGALGTGDEIFLLEMGNPVRIADMAKDLIRLMGKEPGRDVAIVYTGLRPGEKLYEELITEGEGIVPTGHEKILVLLPDGLGGLENEFLGRTIEELLEAARRHDGPAIKSLLWRLVPEYTENESGFVL